MARKTKDGLSDMVLGEERIIWSHDGPGEPKEMTNGGFSEI